MLGLDGRTLDGVCMDPEDPHRVCDGLLRWHFRQSALANMRGAGEPVFERDFAGKDMMKEIREGHVQRKDLSWSYQLDCTEFLNVYSVNFILFT